MNDKRFSELLESAHQALAHAQGKRELRTTVLPLPPVAMHAVEVRRLRTRLRASQAVFARYLNVSTKLVQAWESARRTPEGPALVLLRLTEQNPAVLLAWYATHRRRSTAAASRRRGGARLRGGR